MITKTYTFETDDLGDPAAEPGTRPWLAWVANELRRVLNDKAHITQAIRDLTSAFHKHQGWQEFGFLTWEDFCARYLQHQAEEVETTLGKHGGDRRSDKYQDSNCYLENSKDRGANYTVARLQRDKPDLAKRVRSGELSANAAAIEAGWRKPAQRYSLPDDPTAAGRYLAGRVSLEWLGEMIEAYYSAAKGES